MSNIYLLDIKGKLNCQSVVMDMCDCLIEHTPEDQEICCEEGMVGGPYGSLKLLQNKLKSKYQMSIKGNWLEVKAV